MSGLSWWVNTNPVIQKPKLESEPFKVCGIGNTGRRGTPIVFEGISYKNWTEASRATGLTKATIRYRIRKA